MGSRYDVPDAEPEGELLRFHQTHDAEEISTLFKDPVFYAQQIPTYFPPPYQNSNRERPSQGRGGGAYLTTLVTPRPETVTTPTRFLVSLVEDTKQVRRPISEWTTLSKDEIVSSSFAGTALGMNCPVLRCIFVV